ncbi:Zn-ribbon-containing, possibly RNA-binding protein and truncated derivatives [Sebaldella termitidis]|jgi:hypothetical protein|uniref:DUF721 domain-containing protein n=1 Tax=Sebaldella termitidis (strain ATCC 33386 / NCTC 11300) TaxID=526218 RepID=D1AIT0_SEBTE|nr:DUF721 domain-containing protein [Sebaldella termitidis]ACZ06892.1 protein of unknown function DUF721 [Sebaldella termitidis ATCC 33386]SUI22180.1 Zn-ribbon-containing, possibly RNA-binding protein and truncated derivatives [Sebaldella termitidis]
MNKKKLNRIGEVSISRITENDRYMIHIIRKNWKKIVGDVIAEYSFPSFFSKGKLTVIVENNLIMSEMKMYRETILENVNEEFHGTAVSEIYIKGGKIHNNRDIYNEHKETEETAEITAEEKEKIERLFPDVENNELAERIKNIALNSKINEKILLKKGYIECERCGDLFLGEEEMCIKCRNELENEKMGRIKKLIEKNPVISYRETEREIEELTEGEFYKARDQLAEDLTLFVSELIEQNNLKEAGETAEKYALYRTGSSEVYIINKVKEELLNRLTKFLKLRGRI